MKTLKKLTIILSILFFIIGLGSLIMVKSVTKNQYGIQFNFRNNQGYFYQFN